MQRTSWITLGALLVIGAIVIGSSLTAGSIRCKVCIDFAGRSVCRAVDGPTVEDARTGAITNACALLAAGVTDTVACQRIPPRSVECGEAPASDP